MIVRAFRSGLFLSTGCVGRRRSCRRARSCRSERRSPSGRERRHLSRRRDPADSRGRLRCRPRPCRRRSTCRLAAGMTAALHDVRIVGERHGRGARLRHEVHLVRRGEAAANQHLALVRIPREHPVRAEFAVRVELLREVGRNRRDVLENERAWAASRRRSGRKRARLRAARRKRRRGVSCFVGGQVVVATGRERSAIHSLHDPG